MFDAFNSRLARLVASFVTQLVNLKYEGVWLRNEWLV